VQNPADTREVYITRIDSHAMPHRVPQSQTIDWLQWAVSKSSAPEDAQPDAIAFLDRLRENSAIASRGSVLRDFSAARFDHLTLFANGTESVADAALEARMHHHAVAANTIARELFPDDIAPDTVFNVTCTGYDSPNPVQRMLSARGWTNTKHYQIGHMGCYAAFPALRLAEAHVRSGASSTADILHTELCTLHFRPADTRREQLVVQTLFADGAVRLHCRGDAGTGSALRILGHDEVLLQGTEEDMTWHLSEQGFFMTLSRAVPVHLRGAVEKAVGAFLRRRGMTLDDVMQVAIHPGGPRIIDTIAELLDLEEDRIAHSRAVLSDHGNMSSATVPHIWKRMLEDDSIPDGAIVLSMAFGPGLTLVMNLMEKTVHGNAPSGRGNGNA